MLRRLARIGLVAAFLFPAAAAAQQPEAYAHLASYRSRESAEKGWRAMTELYSSVLYFQPTFRIVDLAGKGRFFRLYAQGDQALMRLLCDSLRRRKLYCVLHDTATLQPAPR